MMENSVPTLMETLHIIIADMTQYFESVDGAIRQMAKAQLTIPLPDAFDYRAERRQQTLSSYDSSFNNPYDDYWDLLPEEIQNIGLTLEKQVLAFASAFASQVKSSLLANESDQHDIVFAVKEMRAALKMRNTFNGIHEGYMMRVAPLLGRNQVVKVTVVHCGPPKHNVVSSFWQISSLALVRLLRQETRFLSAKILPESRLYRGIVLIQPLLCP